MPAELVALISHLQFNIYLRKLEDASLPSFYNPRFGPPPQPQSDPAPTTSSGQLKHQFSESEAIPFSSGHRRSLGSAREAADIRHVHQMIPQHFTGLTAVTIDWIPCSHRVGELWTGRILPRESIITVMSSAITTFLRLPNLRELCMWEDECVFTENLLERTLIIEREMGKAIDFDYLRYKEGTSGRIREDKEQREIRISW